MTLHSQPLTGKSTTVQEESVVNNDADTSNKPLLTFGVLADIQYAPIPDGFSYNGRPRYYRHALQAAKHAAKHFEEEQVDFVINLGDIIDGKCQEIEKWCKDENETIAKKAKVSGDKELNEGNGGFNDQQSHCDSNPGHDAVDEVIEALSVYKHGPILHTYGNHELYNLSREDISKKLGIPFVKEPCGDLVGYYQYKSSTCPNIRFVVIDSYDISIMQRCPKNSVKRQKAVEMLSANNPNYPENENSPAGLVGIGKRHVAFNGAVDEPQKIWLRQTLQEAKDCGEKVIILSHQPIIPNSGGDVTLIWNYSDIVDLLRQYKCTIAAAFAGHAHKGGYHRDSESGIHFRVIDAVLESKDPTKTYAIVDYYHDRLEVRGYGDCQSATYHLDHLRVGAIR
jgi:manganese-dependent ADP-ribose/CDP-alcohol diphosphatase